MIGSLNTSKKEALIVGAGVSGLLVGYQLKKMGYQVEIHEASGRSGGLIQTLQTPFGMVETAAHSMMVNATVKKHLDELNTPIVEVNKNSKSRFIVRGGKLRRFPLNAIEAMSVANRFFSTPKHTPNWETASLKDWCLTYLGSPANDYLLAPFVTGVFACTPEELNAKLTFPKLIPTKPSSLYQHFSSLKKNKTSSPAKMMVPARGMQDLIENLTKELKDNIHYHSPILKLASQAANTIYCIPAEKLAALSSESYPELTQALNSIQYSPLITCTVFFNHESFLKKPPNGVGALIPRTENFRTLGVLFNSSAFNERVSRQNYVSLTFMFGGTTDPSALNLSDFQIEEEIIKTARSLFLLKEKPLHIQITRWKQAVPIYSNSLLKAHKLLNKTLCKNPGVLVFSNYSGQVSIRGMIESLDRFNAPQ